MNLFRFIRSSSSRNVHEKVIPLKKLQNTAAETCRVEDGGGGGELPPSPNFLDEDSLHERNRNKFAVMKIGSNIKKR